MWDSPPRSGSGVWWHAVAEQLDSMSEFVSVQAATDLGPYGTLAQVVRDEPSLAAQVSQASAQLDTATRDLSQLRRDVARYAPDSGYVEEVTDRLHQCQQAVASYTGKVRSLLWTSLNRELGGE